MPDVVLGWICFGRPVLVVLCSCVLRLSVGASESTRPEISLSLRALLGCADWWAVLVSLGGVGIDLPRRAELLSWRPRWLCSLPGGVRRIRPKLRECRESLNTATMGGC